MTYIPEALRRLVQERAEGRFCCDLMTLFVFLNAKSL
jgi:hypothetical protein